MDHLLRTTASPTQAGDWELVLKAASISYRVDEREGHFAIVVADADAAAATEALAGFDEEGAPEQQPPAPDQGWSPLGVICAIGFFAMLLVTAFAGVALLLAGIGVYSVFNYDVAVRRQELRIRLALGAARGSIVQLVVNHALVLIAIALAIGISMAFGFTTLLSSLLFGVEASDPTTLIGVSALLAVIAIGASALPAWRLARKEVLRF